LAFSRERRAAKGSGGWPFFLNPTAGICLVLRLDHGGGTKGPHAQRPGPFSAAALQGEA